MVQVSAEATQRSVICFFNFNREGCFDCRTVLAAMDAHSCVYLDAHIRGASEHIHSFMYLDAHVCGD
jgi:hypothetical protein